MTRNPLLDSRRFATAVDRLDAVSAEDRHAAAKHVFDVCIHHVTRVRRTHPSPPNRGHGRPTHHTTPSPEFVFDLIHPHIYRIARRLDRAMRFAETSPHPADASALIVAVDTQGALAALFAVAQNAGVSPPQLDFLALPLRKRSAPALLRTLFSPDMRVANAAKKALRQVTAIASCQNTPWISTIRSAISLRSAPAVTRSMQLHNLLTRLAEILRLVITHAAATAANPSPTPRKRPSRSSLGNLVARPRQSLNYDRRTPHRTSSLKQRPAFKHLFRKKNSVQLPQSTSHVTLETDSPEPFDRHRSRNHTDSNSARRTPRSDSIDDMHSVGSFIMSTAGSNQASIFSNVTESGAGTLFSRSHSHTVHTTTSTIKRDAATAMYIFERLLTKRINPELDDRIKVIDTLAEMATSAFSTTSPHGRKLENPAEFRQVMKSVLTRYGQNIYSIVMDILFRPVREVDANRIGVFSFQEAGIMDIAGLETSLPRRRPTDFPLSAICLPNMDCTAKASASCNAILTSFLLHVPPVCSERMALLTGTINSVFLNCSEALTRTPDGCKWDASKLTSAVDSLAVLANTVPDSMDMALDVIVAEPVTLRLVLETCIRSVGATGRLMAQNSARPSAPKLSDDGILNSLRSWRALVTILPDTSSWVESPSYSSSILFLAQVARRAALISVIQGYRKDKSSGVKLLEEEDGEDAVPMGASVARLVGEFEATRGAAEDANDQISRTMSICAIESECDEENVLVAELYKSVVAMINVPGTNPVDIFFQLYRTVVYLYANDLKKQRKRVMRNATTSHRASAPSGAGAGVGVVRTTSDAMHDKNVIAVGATGQMNSATSESRSQSEEDAKGVLVENIAVDGQLPSRALRRAVMASELDLGEYFDIGQPPSLQHLNHQYSGLALGAHTYEEFAQALAIVLGTLWNKSVMDRLDNPQEAVAMITRDVQRSGSSYLKKVYKRARVIRRREMTESNVDLRNAKFEDRIRRLEEQVASLTNMVQTSLEESMLWTRKKSFPRVLGLTIDGPPPRGDRLAGRNEMHEFICSPSKCFCMK